TNQPGIALGTFGLDEIEVMRGHLSHMFQHTGARLAALYFCPHHPNGLVPAYAHCCGCRKPAPGLLFAAAEDQQIDLPRSWLVGDILDDIEAGRRAGCRTVLIDNGNETEWALNAMR